MEQGGASVGNQVVLLSVAVPARLVSRSLCGGRYGADSRSDLCTQNETVLFLSIVCNLHLAFM